MQPLVGLGYFPIYTIGEHIPLHLACIYARIASRRPCTFLSEYDDIA